MAVTKIATCCYCGTKAALVLRGKDKHELSCGNCGAPLRALKMLHAAPAQPQTKRKKHKPVEKYRETSLQRPQKRRKRKSFGRRVFSEIWDVIEDVVEEVFD